MKVGDLDNFSSFGGFCVCEWKGGRVEGIYLNRRLERGNMHAVEYLVC